jgi:hypothetical protein
MKEKNKIYFNFGAPDKPKFKEVTLDQLELLLKSVYAYDNVRILGELKLDKEKYPNIYTFSKVMATALETDPGTS